jgi:hypothetical protein
VKGPVHTSSIDPLRKVAQCLPYNTNMWPETAGTKAECSNPLLVRPLVWNSVEWKMVVLEDVFPAAGVGEIFRKTRLKKLEIACILLCLGRLAFQSPIVGDFPL